MEFYEQLLFENTFKPLPYFRYVNDTLPFSVMQRNAAYFFRNSIFYIHLWFLLTIKKKSLSFPDVLVEKFNKNFITSVYRKLTLTGQYTRWDSFGPKKRKTNLIGTLVHRALKSCSPEKF